jgi:hypothetical protein
MREGGRERRVRSSGTETENRENKGERVKIEMHVMFICCVILAPAAACSSKHWQSNFHGVLFGVCAAVPKGCSWQGSRAAVGPTARDQTACRARWSNGWKWTGDVNWEGTVTAGCCPLDYCHGHYRRGRTLWTACLGWMGC